MKRGVPEGRLDGLSDPMLGLTAVEARLARYQCQPLQQKDRRDTPQPASIGARMGRQPLAK